MREQVSRGKKTTTGFSIPSLKHPTRGFGLESSAISRQAVPEIQPLDKPVTHDISRIPLRSPQAKLSISQPGDIYEQEADSVAQQVMQRMAQPVNRQHIQRETLPEDEEELQMKPLANSITPLVQREALPEDEEEELQMKPLDNSTLQREALPEDEEEELQMKPMVQRQGEVGMDAAPDLEASINQARGGGVAIADNIREPMEVAFGADFSGVKVHTDGQSDQLNRSIQARAFTTGQDVFFRQGAYEPGSRSGQELIAHELTHFVQQNGGRAVENTSIQRYTESTDRNYQISENKKFAVATAKYPKDIYVSSKEAPMDLPGGLEWESGGNKEIDNITYTQYTADISKYENKKGKPGTEHFCGELARGLTEVDQKVDQSTSDVGGVLYDSDTSPGRDDGWENHYASVVMRDGGDHASFETAVGIPEVWVGMYGKEKGQTFKYKTQEANIERLLSMEDIVLPGKTKMEKSFFDYLFCRQGKEVVITKETKIPRGITAEEAQQWKGEMIAWKETGAEPASEYMKSVIAILNAEQKKLNPQEK
ncbi:eCIS core domain-containing protein [Nostoc sp. DSM 114167]|jgi:hypothetical protein|uniref:eCIS core domain-containing protein n=1 Tax=Nostoc sp. DSM 114167 TaxID=3439050 RepID=UPI004045D301